MNVNNRTEQACRNFSPATTFPQPGGLSRRQFLQAGATVGFGVAAFGLAAESTASAAGAADEPAEIVTHYESDHGAATHVFFQKGQLLTILKPDFAATHWLALTGKILDTPFLDTCRAQVEVALDADTQDVARNLRGFHCMLAYGDYVREVAYAARKVGIKVQTLPKAQV